MSILHLIYYSVIIQAERNNHIKLHRNSTGEQDMRPSTQHKDGHRQPQISVYKEMVDIKT